MNTTSPAPSPAAPAVNPIPDGLRTLTPHIVCHRAADAIVFYGKAFGAIERMRLETPEGKIMHAQLQIGDSVLMLHDEFPEMGALGPKARGGACATLHLAVPDVDAAFARAVAAGAAVKMPVADMFWGDRYGIVEDPFGHPWSIATHLRDLTPAEIAAAMPTFGCQ